MRCYCLLLLLCLCLCFACGPLLCVCFSLYQSDTRTKRIHVCLSVCLYLYVCAGGKITKVKDLLQYIEDRLAELEEEKKVPPFVYFYYSLLLLLLLSGCILLCLVVALILSVCWLFPSLSHTNHTAFYSYYKLITPHTIHTINRNSASTSSWTVSGAPLSTPYTTSS